jgi:hypothetical protein
MGNSSSQFRIVNAANTAGLLTIDNAGAATFSSSVTAKGDLFIWGGNAAQAGQITANSAGGGLYIAATGTNQNIRLVPSGTGITQATTQLDVLGALSGTSAVFSSSVTAGQGTFAVSSGDNLILEKPTGAYLSFKNGATLRGSINGNNGTDGINLNYGASHTTALAIASTGAATFSGNLLTKTSTDAVYDTNSSGTVTDYWSNQFSTTNGTAKTLLGAVGTTSAIVGYTGINTAGKHIITAGIYGNMVSTTAGAETGNLIFYTKPSNGAMSAYPRLTIDSTGAATFNSTVTLPNNTYLQFNNSSGTARTILAVDTSNSTVLRPAASGGVIAIQNYANTVNLLTIAESTGYTTLASPQATVGNDGGAQKKLVTIGLDGQDYRYRYILLCKVPTFGNSTVNCGFRGTITMERTNGIGIDVHDDFDLTVSYSNTIEFRQTSYQSYQTSLVQLPYNGVQYLALFIYSAPGYSVAYIDAIQTNYGSWLDGNEFTALNYATSQHSSISYGTNNTTFKTTVVATGDVTAYSDRNLKTNINTIDNALSKLNLLRGVSYNRTDIETDKLKIGVIAQEVEEVIPEVVSTDKNGVKSVAYGNMVGVLIEAIKEQQTQIEELKTLIHGLTK